MLFTLYFTVSSNPVYHLNIFLRIIGALLVYDIIWSAISSEVWINLILINYKNPEGNVETALRYFTGIVSVISFFVKIILFMSVFVKKLKYLRNDQQTSLEIGTSRNNLKISQ